MSDEEKTEPEEVSEETEEKPPAKKAAKKPAKKAAKKSAKKEEEKTADKPKGSAKQYLDKGGDMFAKIGYIDIYDILTLSAGILGLLFTLLGLFFEWIPSKSSYLSLTPFSTLYNIGMAALLLYILQIYIYVCLIFFPFVVDKIGMPLINKWKMFPLHFIKTREDLRAFIIFLGWWSCLFFWFASDSWRTIHFICVVILLIVIFSGPLGGKSIKIKGKHMPEKKVKE